MYRTDTLSRYKSYLNEMIDESSTGGLTNPDFFRKKYGVTTSMFSFLKKKGLLTFKNKKWFFNRTAHFDINEISTLKAEFNRFRYQLKVYGKEEENPPVRDLPNNSKMAEFTTKELIAELKSRGWSGEIYMQKSIKF